MTSLKTLWGATCTQYLTLNSVIGRKDLIEIQADLDNELCNFHKKTVRFSHWYVSGDDLIDQSEREEKLIELFNIHKALSGIVTVTPRLSDDSRLPKRIELLSRKLKNSDINLFYDFGKMGPPSWIDRDFCVYDPLWFSGTSWGRYWKVHGWHSDRWVRKYSTQDLYRLVKKVVKHRPDFVVLGHSQGFNQLRELRNTFDLNIGSKLR